MESNNTRRRKTLQKPKYVFVRSIKKRQVYTECFRPDPEVEKRLLGISEMVQIFFSPRLDRTLWLIFAFMNCSTSLAKRQRRLRLKQQSPKICAYSYIVASILYGGVSCRHITSHQKVSEQAQDTSAATSRAVEPVIAEVDAPMSQTQQETQAIPHTDDTDTRQMDLTRGGGNKTNLLKRKTDSRERRQAKKVKISLVQGVDLGD